MCYNIIFLVPQLFFEGVQVKVAQGVKESEISYQVAFSKQELRQVIREYPAREVKKGLDHLYKKVDKHLCEEENLLQVWIKYLPDKCSEINILLLSFWGYKMHHVVSDLNWTEMKIFNWENAILHNKVPTYRKKKNFERRQEKN